MTYETETDEQLVISSATLQHKREAIRKIEKKANEYQSKVVGTNDNFRSLRFQFNAEAARHYVSGTAADYHTSMLQMQLDANIAANNQPYASLDLATFAAVIVGLERIMFMGVGLVEYVLITGRSYVNEADTAAEIDEALERLSVEAEEKFTAIQAEFVALFS